jgi:hypothetical protein
VAALRIMLSRCRTSRGRRQRSKVSVSIASHRQRSAVSDRRSIMQNMKHSGRASALIVAAAFAAAGVMAQTFVYPAKGQSPDQQKKDEGECNTWAVQQSKYDPAKPPPPPATAQAPTTATGTTPGAGARGAARGAVVGEVVGGDASTGAAVGAVAARGQSRRQNATQAQQQSQAATQQQQAGMAAHQKARSACLEGRGYTVK